MTARNTNPEVARVEEDPGIDSIDAMARKDGDALPYPGSGEGRGVASVVKPRHTARMGI